jgi:hypothetical protein
MSINEKSADHINECGDNIIMTTRSGKPFGADPFVLNPRNSLQQHGDQHQPSPSEFSANARGSNGVQNDQSSLSAELVDLFGDVMKSALSENLKLQQNILQEFSKSVVNGISAKTNHNSSNHSANESAHFGGYFSSEDEDATTVQRPPRRSTLSVRFPPFTGAENMEVWLNRFGDIACRQQWTDEEKLDAILPKLQGAAGDFVFGQLPRATRSDFRLLVRELSSRFHKIENPKTFIAQFRCRYQKRSEPVEEFAADLKRLYDKAYKHRDEQTRQEDLLRKFLDGLEDEAAQFHVEYVKEPKSIDDAVSEVIHYQSARTSSTSDSRRSTKGSKVQIFRVQDDSESEVPEDDKQRLARLPGRPKKPTATAEPRDQEPDCLSELKKLRDDLTERLQKLEESQANAAPNEVLERLKKLEDHSSPQPKRSSPKPRTGGPRDTPNAPNNGKCYKCGQVGHYARSCLFVSGQFQVSKQPNNVPFTAPFNPCFNQPQNSPQGQQTQWAPFVMNGEAVAPQFNPPQVPQGNQWVPNKTGNAAGPTQ